MCYNNFSPSSSPSKPHLDILKSKNPVFSVQYTYARINQLLAKSDKKPKVGKYSDEESMIALSKVVMIVIENGLKILGISTPKKM